MEKSIMPALKFQSELTSLAFAETGRPASGYKRADGEVVALCTEFDSLYWPGRAIYDGQRLRYRISLYTGDLEQRIGIFDNSRYPINDVAFHPTQPILAIGTGSYDGGWMFEGDLWIWNWETDEVLNLIGESSDLFPASREVVQCRFLDESHLGVSIRPSCENDVDDAFETYYGLIAENFEEFRDCDVESLGFPVPPGSIEERRQTFLDVIGDQSSYEERARVWDMQWLEGDHIAIVHDNCHLEVWNLNGTREYHQAGEGFGVQILGLDKGLLINVINRGNHLDDTDDETTLYRFNGSELTKVFELNVPVSMSIDKDGNILCRDTGGINEREGSDQVFANNLSRLYVGNLGHYDCFNHFMRLDCGDGLYFLRGRPASSSKNKQLCCLKLNGLVDAVMDWDEHEKHLMESSACWGPEHSLIRSFSIHDPRPNYAKQHIQRCEIATGRVLWTRDISSIVTSMIMIKDSLLAYGLTDGTIGILNVVDGAILFEKPLIVGGAPTIATAFVTNGVQIAVGTIDARLLMFNVDGLS